MLSATGICWCKRCGAVARALGAAAQPLHADMFPPRADIADLRWLLPRREHREAEQLVRHAHFYDPRTARLLAAATALQGLLASGGPDCNLNAIEFARMSTQFGDRLLDALDTPTPSAAQSSKGRGSPDDDAPHTTG